MNSGEARHSGSARVRLHTVTDGDPPDHVVGPAQDVVISLRAAALTVTLPAAGDAGAGRCLVLRAAGHGAVQVRGNDADQIIGRGIIPRPAIFLSVGEAITLISDGDRRWIAIAELPG